MPPVVEVGQVELFALGRRARYSKCRRTRACVAGPPSPREALVAGAGNGANLAGSTVDLAHAVVQGVGDVDVALWCDGETVHAIKPCLHRRPVVAGVALFSRPGHCAENPLAIDLAHAVAGVLHQEQIAGAIEVHAEGACSFASRAGLPSPPSPPPATRTSFSARAGATLAKQQATIPRSRMRRCVDMFSPGSNSDEILDGCQCTRLPRRRKRLPGPAWMNVCSSRNDRSLTQADHGVARNSCQD